MNGTIRVIRDNVVKMTLPAPSVTIKTDGTIWMSGAPLLGSTDESKKSELVAAIKSKKWDAIPANLYTRMGQNDNGLLVLDDAAWQTHPLKIAADAAEAEKRSIEARTVTITLSTRGWGDFDSCVWRGDITRPDSEILAECRHNLNTEHDVDRRDQSDDEILTTIRAARDKHSLPKIEQKPVVHGPGYCYSCETYCYGDCGDYQPTITNAIMARKLNAAAKENDFGIND